MEGYSGACRKGVVSADSGRGGFVCPDCTKSQVRQNVCPPGSSGTWSTQSVLCRAEIPSRTEIEGFLSLFFAGWVFAICCGCIWKRTQTTQTRLTAQQRVALAYGELLPQPRLSVASSLYQKRPQSGCGMREPEARSYNTTAGRVGAARRQAGATRCCAEGCVCVGRERARAMSKPERLATLRSFSKYIRWFAYTAITKC